MMKKLSVVTIAVAIVGIVFVGLASAGWNVPGMMGYSSGYCGNYGTNSAYYDNYASGNETLSMDDALEIFETEVGIDIQPENIYQMGKWWVVYYANDDGVVIQSYIDAFTGDVLDGTSQTYNYAPARRGYGMVHGFGYGPGMGYGGMYR
ncbi:hypothetical protein J2755_001744 [Methanohalophilus levihalophilus]|uniref:PepSY domain-containing protein n=1 Tax=Methanohalophilus levihalophilus TaxID=1431282 RepID=UPI001AE79C06|nr:PepSY domain-containing protein [Methanohalophilus levihalophilus]MBP2030796.1 hypothetical protein [Methanohalophilus levihalophilus]